MQNTIQKGVTVNDDCLPKLKNKLRATKPAYCVKQILSILLTINIEF